MSTQGSPVAQPGQSKRLVGSMILSLGVGLILETSYQWSGISIILVGVALVVLGWKAHWEQSDE